MKKVIGIIGFGNMGSAIAERIKIKYRLVVFDKDKRRTAGLSTVSVLDNNIDLVKKAEAIILAVKPQDFSELLAEIKDSVKDKLVISIAAGITTSYIEKILGKVRVIRVMPNLPAKIGKGISCLCKGKFAQGEDLVFTKRLFKGLGETLVLSEEDMDGATAISGSGPGYLYDLSEGKSIAEIKEYADKVFIPSFIEAAKDIGFSDGQAVRLVSSTTSGSIALLEVSGLPPLDLKKQITSKGGTTEAGLEALHRNGSLTDAVKAAFKRAKELSKRS